MKHPSWGTAGPELGRKERAQVPNQMLVFWAVCSDGDSEVGIPSDHVVASALCLVKAVTLGCVLIGSSLEDSWPVHFPLM